MTRTQYRQARRLIRDNGRFALRWLPKEHAAAMESVLFRHPQDNLAERANCYDALGWSFQLAKSIAQENGAIVRFNAKIREHKAAMSQFQGVAA